MHPTDNAVDVTRRFTARLGVIALGSIVAAGWLWSIVAPGPAGRDPFYGAVAIEFAVWGAINALLVLNGWRGLRRLDPERAATLRTRTLGALRVNGWLNVLWLTLGVAMIAAGYHVWSPSLTGHGIGVLVQGAMLTLFDARFTRALRARSVPTV